MLQAGLCSAQGKEGLGALEGLDRHQRCCGWVETSWALKESAPELVCAACVIIHRLCCQAAPWGRAGQGSAAARCHLPISGVGLLSLSSAVQGVVPLSLFHPHCPGSQREAANGLMEGNSTWGSPCPTCPPPPAFPAHKDLWLPQVTCSQAHTTPKFCGCQLPQPLQGVCSTQPSWSALCRELLVLWLPPEIQGLLLPGRVGRAGDKGLPDTLHGLLQGPG